MMIPVSFRGFQLNSGGVSASFDRSWQRPSLSLITVTRQGREPKATAVEEEAWTLPMLGILIDGDDATEDEALRLGLIKAFDSRTGAGALIVADEDGGNERTMYVACQNLEQEEGKAGLGFAATLVAADDPFWESVAETTASVTMNSSTKTFSANNPGDVDVYPEIEIGESGSIAGSSYWKHRKFCAVRWPAPNGARNWMVELTDNSGFNTAALVSGGKVSNAGQMGVIVDGVEVDRWYGAADGSPRGFNSTSTYVWANLDFRAGLTARLVADNGDEIVVTEDISAWPATGILLINAELFTYTGRDLYRRAFTGVSGGAYDSTPGSHTSGATVHWIQHEVWIVYSPGWTAKTADNSRKPIIDLNTSWNGAWYWNEFGSAAEPERPGQWTPLAGGTGCVFTGDEDGAATDPFQVAGVALLQAGSELAANYSRWQIFLPCGLSAYELDGSDFVDGFTEIFVSRDGAAWEYSDLSPGADAGWEPWEEDATSLSPALRYLAVQPRTSFGDSKSQVESAVITFQTAQRPSTILYPEANNYHLHMVITNLTTGEEITVAPQPGLKQMIESAVVDTDAGTAVIMPGGRNIYHAVARDALRPKFLRLAPGANSIQVSENPAGGSVVTFTYAPRWYV